jgi:hypothetical protein
MLTHTKKAFPTIVMLTTAVTILTVSIISFRAIAGNTPTQTIDPYLGWIINPDPQTTTTVGLSRDVSWLGMGSMFVGPITNTINAGNDMFIAEYYPQSLQANAFRSFAYDLKLVDGRTAADIPFFKTSIFVSKEGSQVPFDCRYDYVANPPTTDGIMRASHSNFGTFAGISALSDVSCPITLEEFYMDSTYRIAKISLSMGDTTEADTGLAAYLDNFELVAEGRDPLFFNFEPLASTRQDCEKNGWKKYGFKSQGQCLKAI